MRIDGVDVSLGAATPTTKDVTSALGAAQETVLSTTSNGVVLTLTLRRLVTARLSACCDGTCGTQRVEGFTLAGVLAASTSATATLVNGYGSWAPSYADGVVVRVESGFGGDSLPLTAAPFVPVGWNG